MKNALKLCSPTVPLKVFKVKKRRDLQNQRLRLILYVI